MAASDLPSPPFDLEKIAIAIHHDRVIDEVPKIVAKGRGAMAEQILEIAFANQVRVREDKALAEILSVIEVDCEIPLEAFMAVAEILAYIYHATRPAEDPATDNGAVESPVDSPADFSANMILQSPEEPLGSPPSDDQTEIE